MRKKVVFVYYKIHTFGGINKVLSSLATELINDYDITFLILTEEYPNYYYLAPEIKKVFINIYDHWSFRLCVFLDKYLRFLPKRNNIKAYILHIGVYFKLREWLLKNHKNYDTIISCHYKLSSFISTMKNVNSKTIAWEHSNYRASGLYRYFRKYYKHIKSVVSINSTSEKYYNQYNSNSRLIPNIIGTPFEEQDYIPIKQKENHILFVGQLVPEKNVKELIEIFIEAKLPANWDLQIVGNGPQEKELINFVKNQKFQCRIHFHGSKTINEVKEYMKTSKICCFTSVSESFGLALVEAMFCSNILFAYDADGPRDIINPYNGFLIPLKNKAEYIATLKNLIEDENLMNKLNKSSYDESQKRRKEQIIKKWKELI